MKVAEPISIAPAGADPELVAQRLAALAHPARLEILRTLGNSGCCCCKDVVDTLDLAQSTVSQHLKILVGAGLVRYGSDRQRSRYSIDRAAMAELSKTVSGLLDDCCGDGTNKGDRD
jgi:DNA-binding transcriptional ArsR family regulator